MHLLFHRLQQTPINIFDHTPEPTATQGVKTGSDYGKESNLWLMKSECIQMSEKPVKTYHYYSTCSHDRCSTTSTHSKTLDKSKESKHWTFFYICIVSWDMGELIRIIWLTLPKKRKQTQKSPFPFNIQGITFFGEAPGSTPGDIMRLRPSSLLSAYRWGRNLVIPKNSQDWVWPQVQHFKNKPTAVFCGS